MKGATVADEWRSARPRSDIVTRAADAATIGLVNAPVRLAFLSSAA